MKSKSIESQNILETVLRHGKEAVNDNCAKSTESQTILETILRHGKEAATEGYTSYALTVKTEPAWMSRTSPYTAQCQSPAYASSASSDRATPMDGPHGESSVTQKSYQDPMKSVLNYEQSYLDYNNAQTQNTAAPNTVAPSYACALNSVYSGNNDFKTRNLVAYNSNNDAYGKNNNNSNTDDDNSSTGDNSVKNCLQEENEFKEGHVQNHIDYSWMKSNTSSNGTLFNNFYRLLLAIYFLT